MSCKVRRHVDASVCGPFEIPEVAQWVWDGLLVPDDEISLDDGSTWCSVSNVGDLSSLFHITAQVVPEWSDNRTLHTWKHKRGIDLAPMIDVVFLLLIFFMAEAHLVSSGDVQGKSISGDVSQELAVSVPKVSSVPNDEKKEKIISITLLETQQVRFLGKELSIGDFVAEMTALKRKNDSDLAIIINATPNTPYGKVVQIIADIEAAKVGDVMLGTVFEGS